MKLIFEWDKNKANSNLRKHNISFDEATSVFEDKFLLTFPDDFNSDAENRFISIGFSTNSRVLLVINTEHDENKGTIVIRIISCRKATAAEREIYEKGK
jgi:uncharacterized DUF497 family protein